MQILIADDDPMARTVLAKILETMPENHVTVAADGVAAWRLLDDPARSFDVAFLDLAMPRMTGFEVVQRVRESPLLKSLKIVFCTVSNDRATVLKAAETGVRHYLVKPFTDTAVQAKLAELEKGP